MFCPVAINIPACFENTTSLSNPLIFADHFKDNVFCMIGEGNDIRLSKGKDPQNSFNLTVLIPTNTSCDVLNVFILSRREK